MMKVLLPACEIPNGSIVTKATGQKPYLLTDKVTIYGGTSSNRDVIESLDGTRFMSPTELSSGMSASINAVSGDTVLAWHVEPETLYDWLRDHIEGTSQ